MKQSIVLAGGAAAELLGGLQRLVPVVGYLENAGVSVETLVGCYPCDYGIDELEKMISGATFVRSERSDGTVLERWRACTGMATGDLLWLIGSDAHYSPDRITDHLAVLRPEVQVAYDRSQALVRRSGADLLELDQEAPAALLSSQDAVDAIVQRAGRLRRRALPVPAALPAIPFAPRQELLSDLYSRRWHDATIYEGSPGRVKVGRYGGADVGTIIRQWAYHQEIIIGNFTYLGAGVLVSNPSDGLGPADRMGPTGLRPTYGHNVNLATVGVMYEHVRAIEHRYVGAVRMSPLIIGHDVWVGSQATILGGITVGHGAIVSVGSVVLSDVPPYAVVEGNPAKVVRMRFSPDIVESLLRINWWDWDEPTMAARADWFTRPITEFCDRFDPVRTAALFREPSDEPVRQAV